MKAVLGLFLVVVGAVGLSSRTPIVVGLSAATLALGALVVLGAARGVDR